MEVILLFQADNDIQTAYNWYEEIQPARGDLFIRQVDLAFGMLQATTHRLSFRGTL